MTSHVDRPYVSARQKNYELAARLLLRQENEISRIKRELHDCLGPLHFAIGANVKWVSAHCSQEAVLGERLRETMQLIEDAVQATQRLSSTLRSDALSWGTTGLEEVLIEYAATLEERADIPIRFTSQLLKEEALTPEAASHMQHIGQEALYNAIRHARATAIVGTLNQADQELLLTIEDNGMGFDLAAQLSSQTTGLEEMFARTRLLDGELHIQTAPGQGTMVQLRAPIVSKRGCSR